MRERSGGAVGRLPGQTSRGADRYADEPTPAVAIVGPGRPAAVPGYSALAAAPGRSVGRDRAAPPTPGRRTAGWRRRYVWALVTGDLLVGGVVALLALWVAAVPPVSALLGPPVLVVLLAVARGYEDRFLLAGVEEFRRLGAAGAALAAVTSTLALATGAPVLRGPALVEVPGLVVGVLLVHLLARGVLRALRRCGRLQQRVVVIGLERSVAELVRTARSDRGAGFDVVAACVSGPDSDRIEGVPVLGRPEDVLAVLDVCEADTVILTAWSDVDPQELRRLSWDLEGSGTHLLVAPRLAETSVPRLHLRTVGGLALLDVDEPEFTGVRRVVKIGLDYLLTLAGLMVLAPVMAAVAVAVRVTSPGPVFFRQERIGRHGRPFVMHKFRSMYVDAEQRLADVEHLNEHGNAPLFKLRSDPRVTPVGAFLRRYSLDELPQLFDVLLGRMSLVGPRPPLPTEVARYEEDVRRRLLVRPGITGLWQVSGRSDLSWDESVRLDLHYVENWFLGLDLSIIARTVSAVLTRRGAY